MIVDNLNLGPWAPGEHTRYEACPRHTAALSRMDFDQAVDRAEACPSCRVQYRWEDKA